MNRPLILTDPTGLQAATDPNKPIDKNHEQSNGPVNATREGTGTSPAQGPSNPNSSSSNNDLPKSIVNKIDNLIGKRAKFHQYDEKGNVTATFFVNDSKNAVTIITNSAREIYNEAKSIGTAEKIEENNNEVSPDGRNLDQEKSNLDSKITNTGNSVGDKISTIELNVTKYESKDIVSSGQSGGIEGTANFEKSSAQKSVREIFEESRNEGLQQGRLEAPRKPPN